MILFLTRFFTREFCHSGIKSKRWKHFSKTIGVTKDLYCGLVPRESYPVVFKLNDLNNQSEHFFFFCIELRSKNFSRIINRCNKSITFYPLGNTKYWALWCAFQVLILPAAISNTPMPDLIFPSNAITVVGAP